METFDLALDTHIEATGNLESKKFQMPEEKRVLAYISSISIIGKEVYQYNGRPTEAFRIGIQLDTYTPRKLLDGKDDGYWSFWIKYTFSYSEKGKLLPLLTGIRGFDKTKTALIDFIKQAIGRQISGILKTREYVKDGITKEICEIGDFKPLKEDKDITKLYSLWKPAYWAAKKYPNALTFTYNNALAGQKKPLKFSELVTPGIVERSANVDALETLE